MNTRSKSTVPICRTRMPAGDDASRLAKLKAAIQTGEYETPEKLEETLRSVLADLRKLQPRIGVSRADETGGERP